MTGSRPIRKKVRGIVLPPHLVHGDLVHLWDDLKIERAKNRSDCVLWWTSCGGGERSELPEHSLLGRGRLSQGA